MTSRFFFYLLVTLFTFQLGKHFWFDFSYISEIKSDYLSLTIYLSDLIIILMLVSWVWEEKLYQKPLSFRILPTPFYLFIAAYGLSALLAVNKGASLLALVKILEFSFLALYLKYHWAKINLKKTFSLLLFGGLVSSLIALGELLKGGDLGLWILGERSFTASTINIAQSNFNGHLLLRPYSTFPHPNVLGGYLAILSTLTVWAILKKWGSRVFKIVHLLIFLATLVLSVSLSAISAFILGVGNLALLWLNRGQTKPKLTVITIGILLTASVLVISWLPLNKDLSIERRIKLNQAAVEMIAARPLLGFGPNNFVVVENHYFHEQSPVRFIQPVHNLFLLIGSEAGLLALGFFLWFLLTIIKKVVYARKGLLIIIWVEVILISFFDHYFWTLQQGQIILWSLIGISLTLTGEPGATRARPQPA